MDQLGEALDQLLHERAMSQAELGRRLDITGSAVNLWVRGRAKPSREHLERIEDELEVEPRGFLLGLAGYSTNDDIGPTPESLLTLWPPMHRTRAGAGGLGDVSDVGDRSDIRDRRDSSRRFFPAFGPA